MKINHSDLNLNAWKKVFTIKTLALIGIDLLLIISLLVVLFLANSSERFLSKNLESLVSEGQSLQANGVSNSEIASILTSKYNPNINGLMLKIVISYLLFLILGIGVYSFFKLWVWAKLLNKKIVLPAYKRMFLINLVFLLTNIVLSLLLSLKWPYFSAYLFIILSFLTIIVLPVTYIFSFEPFKNWVKLFKRRGFLKNYFLSWGIIIFTFLTITLIISSLITLLGLLNNSIIIFINSLLELIFLLTPIILLNYSRYYLALFNKNFFSGKKTK